MRALYLNDKHAGAEREERLKHKIERAKTQVTYVGVVWIRRALRTHMVRVPDEASLASPASLYTPSSRPSSDSPINAVKVVSVK